MLLSTAGQANAQFWKKKKHHTKSTSGKVTKPHGNRQYKDAFKRKSNKSANVRTRKKPFFKSKKKMHKHSTSRKTKKPGSKKFFKPKYSKAVAKKKSKDKFSRNANKSKRKSKKGGGGSNGIFKGRKK